MMRLLRYLWASPTTVCAIPLVGIVYLTGGTVRVVRGQLKRAAGVCSGRSSCIASRGLVR
jgi:hypothetical protein